MYGGDGHDELSGGAGADQLNGGSGEDNMSGGTGADTLRGDGDADRLSLSSDVSGTDRGFGGEGNNTIELYGRGNIASGESGNDWFSAENGSTSSVTGGAGSDVLAIFGFDNKINVTFTDYVEDQDEVDFSYFNGQSYRDEDAFINLFDKNEDNAISRLDGTTAISGSGQERFAFSTNSVGASVLTLDFPQGHVVLQGADYLI